MQDYKFASDPVADPKAVVSGPTYRFTLLHPMVLRYEWAEDGVFEDRASTLAINRRFEVPEYHVEDSADKLEIFTPKFQVSYNKKRFSRSGLSVSFKHKVTLWGADWRYDQEEPPAFRGNLGGTARTLDEVNGRCDMGKGVLSREGHAALDDSESMLFDGEGFVAPRRSGDRIDGYLFAYGYDFKQAIKAFYAISGPQPQLPRWTLGNWWSRYYRYTADSYLELMDRFRSEKIPMSVAVIDMDWHRIEGDDIEHTGWTGYTWDKTLFPDPVAFCKALRDRNLKVTLNDHPHLGIHHHEDDYEAMAKALSHDTSRKAPILFDPTDQNFLHAYLNILHRNLEKQGCDFWWVDWQQGPISRIPGLDPLWLLNHFHFLDIAKHSPDGSKPVIFSRYGGPGSHRYPVGFSGDTLITWESLAFQPEFTATASNIGYGWWSHDLGGHMHGYRDDELTARWIQLGVFSPILRLHSSSSRWSGKEPWTYRAEEGEAMRDAMRLRHRLIPYLLSESKKGDEPLCQPMYWSYPDRSEAYAYPNQYTFGEALICAPIVQPRNKTTELAAVKVWLPPRERFVDLFTGTVYDGDRELELFRPLELMPVLAAEGAIVPLDGEDVPANGCKNPELFEVLVVVGQDGKFAVLEDEHDDAEGSKAADAERRFEIEWQQARGKLTVKSPARRSWSFRFVSYFEKAEVSLQGMSAKANVTVEKKSRFPGLVVSLSEPVEAGTTFTVDLGADPQLSTVDHLPALEKLVGSAQIDFGVKDQIWKILNAKQPASSKVARLLALGLDGKVIGPFVERLVADGRGEPLLH